MSSISRSLGHAFSSYTHYSAIQPRSNFLRSLSTISSSDEKTLRDTASTLGGLIDRTNDIARDPSSSSSSSSSSFSSLITSSSTPDELTGFLPQSEASSLLPRSSFRKQPPAFMMIPPIEQPLLGYFVSSLQKEGNRSAAVRRVTRMLTILHTLTRAPPMPLLQRAIESAAPVVHCVFRQRGAKRVAVPAPLGEKQRVRHAIQWIIKASDKVPARTVEERVAHEIVAILKGSSSVLNEKRKLHELAMLNRSNIKKT